MEVWRSWARLIRKVYGVDQLLCAGCGGTMRVIAVVEPACADLLARGTQASTADRQPAVVRQIFDHMGIPVPSRADRSPPVRIRLRRTDFCGEATRNLAVHEDPEWTYAPVEDDLPPCLWRHGRQVPDPLTI
jgi:hypothetical protein